MVKIGELLGTLVIDKIPLSEARVLMKTRKGRWITPEGWAKCMSAEEFAMLTHGFPSMTETEFVEFKIEPVQEDKRE